MNSIKSENGYALLMVLMLVLLFTVLGMGLLAMNMNASKQFNLKEEQVQARHQAEMGLLHYYAALKEQVKNYSFTKLSGESNDKALERSRKDLCDLIDEVKAQSDTDSTFKYVVDVPSKSGCDSILTDEKIIINVNSVGTADENTEKIVKGTISLEPPEVTDSTGVPGVPAIPPGASVITNPNFLNDKTSIYEHVVINKKYEQKKQQTFFESFTINMPNENDVALQVNGGSGDYIKVEKDLYIKGSLKSANNACIYVKGNLTVLGDIDIKANTFIIVGGDAYFKGYSPDIKSNIGIYVAGNTFTGVNEILTEKYKHNTFKNNDCSKRVDWKDPGNVAPTTKEYYWETIEELNPEYL